MSKQMVCRAIAVILICAVPLPALAQIREGVMFPARTHQSLASQAPPKANDPDKDSLKEGAIIGALVMGAWCLLICGQGLDRPSQIPLAVAASAGMGALIGAGIDSGFSRSPRVMFRWRF
jgi:hypothetical protein